ncbi:MAG: iron-sulfur cluster assembly scaffold protein [Candidatus Moraniibacteriota bacterium]
MYSKKVLEHFTRPHNQGVIKNPSGVGMVGNPTCGDMMKIYIKVKKDSKKREVISDIKFETLGCASAIATSSMITDLAKNKTLEEASKITRNDVAEALEGLPPIKMHCSNLAADSLREAIKDYREKNSPRGIRTTEK